MAIGTTFDEQIRARLKELSSFHQLRLFAATSEGARIVDEFLQTHKTAYPQYIEEIRATAEGARVAFMDLFILNLRNELSVLMAASGNHDAHGIQPPAVIEDCSDYLLKEQGKHAWVAHNEDGDLAARNRAFLLTASMYGDGVTRASRFSAFVYPGELPTVGFGWNDHGVGFTLNGLYPDYTQTGAIGRNFISRELLEAGSLDEAMAIISGRRMATGHGYNVFSIGQDRPTIISVEVAPSLDGKGPNLFHSHHVVDGAFFRANKYDYLVDVPQIPSAIRSSKARERRAHELPSPTSAGDLLDVLGDTEGSYPIYRTAKGPDSGYTLCTALFDLLGHVVRVFVENPRTARRVHVKMSLVFDRDELAVTGL